MVKPDKQGQAVIEIRNCGPEYYELNQGQVIAILENATSFNLEQIEQSTINEIIARDQKKNEMTISPEDEKFIQEN